MTLLSDLAAALPAQLPLAAAWVLYAVIHSLTASHACKTFTKRHWPIFFASYRITYNVLAVVLLIPVVLISIRTPGPELWAWQGAMAWLMNGLAMAALMSLLVSGGGYDLMTFLGLRSAPAEIKPRLVISGWHRFVRHPWYSLGLVLIWTRDMSAAHFVTAEAITMYFIIGSRLEERKLVAEFGERYREYQRRVPRLFPRPWRCLSKADAERLAG